MRALIKYGLGKGETELREIPVPVIGDDDLLIEVKAAGICGSDLAYDNGEHPEHLNCPVVLGHEFSGVVSQVGLTPIHEQASQIQYRETEIGDIKELTFFFQFFLNQQDTTQRRIKHRIQIMFALSYGKRLVDLACWNQVKRSRNLARLKGVHYVYSRIISKLAR